MRILSIIDKENIWQILRPLLAILAVSTVFGVSVSVIIDLGTIAVVVWCVLVASLAGLYISKSTREIIYSALLSDGKEENQTKTAGAEKREELREFVYLDSLTVQSLLASLNIAIPQETVELSEQIEQVQRRAGLNAGVAAPGGESLGGNVDLSRTETGTEVLETSKRINDQYIFDQLYSELDSRGKITSLPEDWDNSPDGYNMGDEIDMVKIEGEGMTDPIYRMANVLSLVSRIEILSDYSDQNEDMELSEVIADVRDVVFANQIGVEFNVEDDMAYVASVDTDDLWIDDPRREFADSREYTVLGRVVGKIPDNKKWDYIDLFRIGGTVLDDESVGTVRDVVTDFINLVDGYSLDVPLPDLENTTAERLQSDEDVPQQESTIRINVKDKKIYVDGPGLIIDPIAIFGET